jgi:hypothetical protein
MLLNELAQYLASVEAAVRDIQNANVERYEEEVLLSDRINLRIRIRFAKGYLLEMNEAVIVETGQISHLGYRYHFQDQNNRLVFRYDDTSHFLNLPSFPHHKHTPIAVEAAQKPSIIEAINEAAGF